MLKKFGPKMKTFHLKNLSPLQKMVHRGQKLKQSEYTVINKWKKILMGQSLKNYLGHGPIFRGRNINKNSNYPLEVEDHSNYLE